MESGTIPDDQITASSSWDEYHSPYLGRLHLDSIYAWPNHAGGWAAGTNDVNQWLQIDLGIEYNITRVATQGRQEIPHWVAKYNLQYSDDGVTFYTCVDEQGQAEVTIIGWAHKNAMLWDAEAWGRGLKFVQVLFLPLLITAILASLSLFYCLKASFSNFFPTRINRFNETLNTL